MLEERLADLRLTVMKRVLLPLSYMIKVVLPSRESLPLLVLHQTLATSYVLEALVMGGNGVSFVPSHEMV